MIYFWKMISTKQTLRNWERQKGSGCKILNGVVTCDAKHSIKCSVVGKGHTFPKWNAFKDKLYRRERGYGN